MITRHEYVNTVKWLDIYRQAECNFGGDHRSVYFIITICICWFL